MFRKRLSKRVSRKNFRRGTRVKRKNFKSRTMRGGTRL